MRISLHTQSDLRYNVHYGYGKSFVEIQKAFREYRYQDEALLVESNSPRANMQMYYGPHPPTKNAFYPGQYRVHMSQHESTKIFPHKVDAYENGCDEVWTANQWGAQSMINSGVSEDRIHVYEHGLDPDLYVPVLRGTRNKIRFLHIDSGSPRKRADLVEKAFKAIFPKYRGEIELTMKFTHAPHSGEDWLSEIVLSKNGNWVHEGIRYIDETLTNEEMAMLINYHDVLVYPTEGEGFGMIPLEALATGMPVISTHEWCSYSKFLIDEAIESDIKRSKISWGYPRLGDAVIAKFGSILHQMEKAISDINALSKKYYEQAPTISEEYSWQNKTNLFLDSVIDRLGPEVLSVNTVKATHMHHLDSVN